MDRDLLSEGVHPSVFDELHDLQGVGVVLDQNRSDALGVSVEVKFDVHCPATTHKDTRILRFFSDSTATHFVATLFTRRNERSRNAPGFCVNFASSHIDVFRPIEDQDVHLGHHVFVHPVVLLLHLSQP